MLTGSHGGVANYATAANEPTLKFYAFLVVFFVHPQIQKAQPSLTQTVAPGWVGLKGKQEALGAAIWCCDEEAVAVSIIENLPSCNLAYAKWWALLARLAEATPDKACC